MLDHIKNPLWAAADKLRANVDAAEYKHIALGLISLKFISAAFAARRADYILANPPFNISDWWHASLEGDPRWVYGTPPQGNALRPTLAASTLAACSPCGGLPRCTASCARQAQRLPKRRRVVYGLCAF